VKIADRNLSENRIEHFAILGMQTASLVHEMNNQLATIVGTLELFSREELDPRCREKCRNLAKAQKGIVDLVREASALASGRLESFFRTEAIPVEELLQRLKVQVPGLDLPEFPGFAVTCDPRKTLRALADIARNAWQAGASQVVVEVCRTGAVAIFRIVDDGPGIPLEIADRLFAPGTTQGKPAGNGIGLFSARWILEAMGGSLRLERSDPSGTSFLATLPLAEREA
jgi:signal transduction histidine kinase